MFFSLSIFCHKSRNKNDNDCCFVLFFRFTACDFCMSILIFAENKFNMNQNIIKEAVEKYLRRTLYNGIKLQCALFDMDGVLFDSMPYHAKSWCKTFKAYGLDFTEEEAYMHEGRTGEGTINIVMERELGRKATQKEIKEMYAYKSDLFSQYPFPSPIPGAYDLLCKMKQMGLRATVVTGSGQKTLLSTIEKYYPGVFELDKMVTAFDVKIGKPNPEPYIAGLRKMGVAPNNAVVIENAPLGVQAANSAKIFTIAVNTGPLKPGVLTDAGADIVFDSMVDLCDNWDLLVNNINNL